MKLSLIITTYNWPESLFLVLESIKYQKILPDEVIIADDGSKKNTERLIKYFNKNSEINFTHSWQEDLGFRAARSRNKAIYKSSGDYIVLIDGDTILHDNFIKDHIENAEPGYFVQGSRVLISKNKTNKLLSKKNANVSFFSLGLKNRRYSIHSKLLSLLFSNKINHLRSIKSCNMAFYREDCVKINGFNNKFEGWGREDSEFIVRLINSGIDRKNLRFNAIQFHLWHNENSRMSTEKNNEMLIETINNSSQWCENGINSIEKNES
jgi:glycosyltransferase involved in cell wall biosynthesis